MRGLLLIILFIYNTIGFSQGKPNVNNAFGLRFIEERIVVLNKNNNNITNDIRINIVYQLFKAFSYIHRKGYLHRDISLTNVLLKKYDEMR